MKNIKNPVHLYVLLLSTVSLIIHMMFSANSLFSLRDLTLKFIFIICILLVSHYIIHIPPKENSLSLDSSVYIAICLLYGIGFALNVLLISIIIYAIFINKIAWWKHIFNISMYTIMIICMYYTFIGLNGNIQHIISVRGITAYIFSLVVYFLINISTIGYYFKLKSNENIVDIIKLILKESAAAYIVTLTLSLVLIILITAHNLFGLLLFMCIAMLFSIAFRQPFQLYWQANEKANRDFLTGLSNHGYFKDVLDEKITAAHDSSQPLSLALLDIDDFKKYNDFYGHMQGDSLLKFFASILETESNKHEYFAARYGGEEFTILMHNTTMKQAAMFIDRLRKKVNDTYFDGVERLPYHCLSFSAGISEYKKELYDSQELLNRADQAMYSAKAQGKNMIRIADDEFAYSMQNTLSFEKELHEVEQQLNIFLSKDVYTYKHSKRVYKYAIDFSGELELTDAERKAFILGSLVHDIGKLEIPRDIINKKGKLDPHEWEIMKKHVTWGKEIISTNKSLSDLIPLVELHHERFDGDGYPHGLKEYEIPKLARILCIIDSFDAMTTERPYQATRTFTEAIQELRTCAGKQFDPQYVEPFINLIQKIYALQLEMEQTATEA